MAEAYIVAAARTAGGKRGGRVSGWHPVDLGAEVAKALEAKKLAEEAMKNAKTDIDFAKAQGEFATMAAQIAAISKLRKKR